MDVIPTVSSMARVSATPLGPQSRLWLLAMETKSIPQSERYFVRSDNVHRLYAESLGERTVASGLSRLARTRSAFARSCFRNASEFGCGFTPRPSIRSPSRASVTVGDLG